MATKKTAKKRVTRPAARSKSKARSTPASRKPAAKKTARKKSAPRKTKRPDRSLPRGSQPPKAVTRDLFLAWRFPRIGMYNPHKLTNPVWLWIAEHPELSAWSINEHFAGPSSFEVGPGFCCSRFGQSRTTLPDGRVIAIGGEHEDYYDPDFFIYNDVFVDHPTGQREVYGYPQDAFAPTDFHSATLVGDRVFIVGGLSYADRREPGQTPVYALDTATLAINPVRTVGTPPGWIYEHSAELSSDGKSLLIRGGLIIERTNADGHADERTDQVTVENDDEWSLDLESLRWSRAKTSGFEQWEVRRSDGRGHRLFLVESLRWYRDEGSAWAKKQRASLEAEFGGMPDFTLYEARYSPPMPHEVVADREDETPAAVRRIVRGVTVRYVEDSSMIRVVIEGSLPEETARAIVEDVRGKLEKLEGHPCETRRLR
jgi:hypothetical protein